MPPKPSTKTLLQRYEHWTRTDGPRANEKTAKGYTAVVESFLTEYDPYTATKIEIREYAASISYFTDRSGAIRKAAPSTYNRKLAAVRNLFDYLISEGYREEDDNPARLVKAMATPKRLPRPFELDELNAICDAAAEAAANGDAEAIQDAAIFEGAYGTGMRREEMGNAVLSWLLSSDSVRVIGKGDKERITSLNRRGYEAIRDWVLLKHGDERTAKLIEELNRDAAFVDLQKRFPDAPIFYASEDAPCSSWADPGEPLQRRLNEYAEKLGIRDAGMHRFRHSFATHQLENGTDPVTLQRKMGHEKLETTLGYLAVVRSLIKKSANNLAR